MGKVNFLVKRRAAQLEQFTGRIHCSATGLTTFLDAGELSTPCNLYSSDFAASLMLLFVIKQLVKMC